MSRTTGTNQNEEGRHFTSTYTTNRLSLHCKFELIKSIRRILKLYLK
jgi:hypothetical protein